MKVKSAEFKKGIVGDDDILSEPLPQIAFVGRSNVGKSSVINTLADKKELAKSSSVPGRTQQINFFLINKSFYLVDLPGYGYAKGGHEKRDAIMDLIHWYIQNPHATQHAVVLIVDAKVGPTDNDLKMLALLEGQGKKIIVVANKIDKLKTNEQTKSIRAIEKSVNGHLVIPYSAEKRIGLGQLTQAITHGLKL